ncbi:MAG TPA: hypothetical protein VG826_35535 [Pirellulales bacterium]|nr:hypothetical protein [Pirellulales bacterium]
MNNGNRIRIAACLAIGLVLLAATALEICLVFNPARRTYGEGPILAMCEKMQAQSVSAAWMRELPYGLSCYGPAYYWATNQVIRLTGWQHSLVPGRIVALAAGLGIATVIAFTAYRGTRRVEIGLLAAATFLLSLPAVEWLPFARVDTLAMLFVATAFSVASGGRRGLVVAAVSLALGSLAKPTASLAALPILAHLLATRRYREAACFTGGLAVLGMLIWFIIDRLSGGFFLRAVLVGNANPMTIWRGYSLGYQFLTSPVGTGAAFVAAWLLISSPQRFLESLYSLGFLLSLLLAAVLSCKRGAEINYFLEPAILGSLAIAVDGIPRLYELNVRRAQVAMICLSCLMIVPTLREIKTVRRSLSLTSRWSESVRLRLADEPADVGLLADGKMMDVVLASGHESQVSDPYLYTMLVGSGALHPAPVVERMRDGRIKWLVFHRHLAHHQNAVETDTHSWPPEVLAELPRYYELVEEQAGLYIYRHRGAELASAAR